MYAIDYLFHRTPGYLGDVPRQIILTQQFHILSAQHIPGNHRPTTLWPQLLTLIPGDAWSPKEGPGLTEMTSVFLEQNLLSKHLTSRLGRGPVLR